MSFGKDSLPTVSRQFLTRNYHRPNCLLKRLLNCLSPTREGFFFSFKMTPRGGGNGETIERKIQKLSGTPSPRYFLKSIAGTNGRRIAGTNKRRIAGTNWRCTAAFPFLQSLGGALRHKLEVYRQYTSQTSCTGWGFLNSAQNIVSSCPWESLPNLSLHVNVAGISKFHLRRLLGLGGSQKKALSPENLRRGKGSRRVGGTRLMVLPRPNDPQSGRKGGGGSWLEGG